METLSNDLPEALQREVLRVLQMACDKELRLAVAESCTGGLVASVLTDIEGCSHAFERGFVVYTEAAKREMLGVPGDMLENCGAVSRPVAIAMAEGALQRSDAQIAFAVTGFAGPGGEGSEEGLVHFACAREGRPTRHREAHYGPIGRGAIRVKCLKVAMEMFEDMLE